MLTVNVLINRISECTKTISHLKHDTYLDVSIKVEAVACDLMVARVEVDVDFVKAPLTLEIC